MSWLLKKAADKAERALNDRNGRQQQQQHPQPQPPGHYSYGTYGLPPADAGNGTYGPPTTYPYNTGGHGSGNPFQYYRPMLEAIQDIASPQQRLAPPTGTAGALPAPALHPAPYTPPPPAYRLTPSPKPAGLPPQPALRRNPAPTTDPAPKGAREYVPDGKSGPRLRKILVLDGGGVRGLSEIILLQEIMERLSRERGCPEGVEIHPWEEFDMICGTSTGGLLAIMLGRLRMSLDQVEKAYKRLSEMIFTPVKSRTNSTGGGYDFYKSNGRFDARPLEQTIQDILISQGQSPHASMYDADEDGKGCKIFVCAMTGYSSPQCLRSYRNPKAADRLLHKCQIWQAARATSAASMFFDPIDIDDVSFIDGALMYNNPIQLAEKESRELFGDVERMFVSLGTGQGIPGDLTGDAVSVSKSLFKLLNETEERNNMFHNEHQEWVKENKLFRFNVTHGVGEIGLEEYQRVKEIKGRTIAYLGDFLTSQDLARCSTALRSGGQRLHIIAGSELRDHYERLHASSVNADWCAGCQSGVKFNEESSYCLECEIVLHKDCIFSHEYRHTKSLVRYTYVLWQERSKTYDESGVCANCASRQKCRLSCQSCNFSLCSTCHEDKTVSSSILTKHVTANTSHREYIHLVEPYMRCEYAPTGSACRCVTMPNVLFHCPRCLAPVQSNQIFYTCTTCRREYGSSQAICQACFGVEDSGHLAKHSFAAVSFQADTTPSTVPIRAWCHDCDRSLQFLELFSHPHGSMSAIMSEAAEELMRHDAVRRCPTRVALDVGRPTIPNPVPEYKCALCKAGASWEQPTGLCVVSNCGATFCNLCYSSGRHCHRHQPLHMLQYRQNTANGFNLSQPISCDGCGNPSYRGLFVGLECQTCQNVHFCGGCLQKLTQGTLTIPGNGRHGRCPVPGRWTLYRY